MARTINTTPSPASANSLLGSLVGPAPGARVQVQSGRDMLASGITAKILGFGPIASGKNFMELYLLLAGQKVLRLETDFGSTGKDNTILNYFKDHPEHVDLLDNERVVTVNPDGLEALFTDPAQFMPDIYTWDPDWIFWNGVTAYQQADLERVIFAEEDVSDRFDKFKGYRQTKNKTVFPLLDFLKLKNVETGRDWNKIATMLESTKATQKKKVKDKWDKIVVEDVIGSEKTGPMLDTTARDLAGAGFDLVIETSKTVFGSKDTFEYISRGADLMVKDRNFKIPERCAPSDFWFKHILPRLGVTVPEGTKV